MLKLNNHARAAMLLLAFGAAGQAAASCSVSTTGMAFGRYQPLTFAGKLTSQQVISDATLRLSCQGIVTGGSYSISLGPSSVGSGDRINTRYLAHAAGGDPMAFNIYHDATHMTIWGDGVSGSALAGTIPAGDSEVQHVVYGAIAAGQSTLRAGNYSDTLVVTLTYMP